MYTRTPKTLALALSILLLGCASRWGGSIGAVLGKNNHDGRVFLREVPADMGAAKVGLRTGDELTAIEDKPVSGMTAEEIHAALAGAVGTKVKLTVQRDGQPLTFVIERGPLRGG